MTKYLRIKIEDRLHRQLKAKAALESKHLHTLVEEMLERGALEPEPIRVAPEQALEDSK
jgi:predicted HicB family RNase H-like nuclease